MNVRKAKHRAEVVIVDSNDLTRKIENRDAAGADNVRRALLTIYQALLEKGYDPVRQMAHFLLTGEPTYITAHRQARSLAQKLERDEVLEEILREYLASIRTPRD